MRGATGTLIGQLKRISRSTYTAVGSPGRIPAAAGRLGPEANNAWIPTVEYLLVSREQFAGTLRAKRYKRLACHKWSVQRRRPKSLDCFSIYVAMMIFVRMLHSGICSRYYDKPIPHV